MNVKKLKTNLDRLENYLALVARTNREMCDIEKRIDIEDQKSYLNSYLLTPRAWYVDRLRYLNERLEWAKKRIKLITYNLYYDEK